MQQFTSFLQWLDGFSFRKIFSSLLVLSMILFVPYMWWASSQKYTYKSKAALEPTRIPTPVIYGSLPQGESKLKGIDVFSAKVGDQVVLKGENLGNRPAQSHLYFGGIEATEIISWRPSEIVAVVPESALSGEISLILGEKTLSWARPLTIFTSDTLTQVVLDAGKLYIENPINIAKVEIWINGEDGARQIAWEENEIKKIPFIKTLDWIVLYDQKGDILPFWVDPLTAIAAP